MIVSVGAAIGCADTPRDGGLCACGAYGPPGAGYRVCRPRYARPSFIPHPCDGIKTAESTRRLCYHRVPLGPS